MSFTLSRRQVLGGGSAILAAATMGLIRPNSAFAAHNKIVVRLERDLGNLDPANRTGPPDVNILNACMQGLIGFKPGSTEWQLDAASEITQVSDTEISFKLRPDLAFTGGYGALTADDVKFSFERFIKADAAGKKVDYASDWAALDHVEVTGPLEGKIVLKSAAPALWVITLADGSGRIISKKAFEKLGDKFASTVIGSGPYMLKEWKPREEFTLALNPDYKGPIKGHFQEIVGKPIKEQKTADIAFKAGEIDFERIEPQTKDEMAKLPDTSVLALPGIDYVWFGPNIEKKPFDDVRVRQALRLAVDVDAILQTAYAGLYPRANALLAQGMVGYWADAPVYKRDVDGAKKLLADAGQGGGFKTSITILGGDARYQSAATVIQANLADVGIDLQINTLDSGAYWALGEKDGSKVLDLSLIEYSGKFDPSFQTQWFTSAQVGQWNWQRWKSKDFDDLDAEGAKTTDSAKRQEIYVKAQKLMDDSAAFVWITHNVNTYASRSWMKPGVLPNGNGWLYTAFEEA
ncbi:MAG TPA: ABC transporter substrate-binding protein [Candidatus Polarisedimenticolia bacterium]|jgi:peptide/nickel transport system substrate-binding protein|nr:ABC transporter substrate-binding protein [Dongiaceae bacterium]HYV90114.1 ABC transporter substrate-binding protein [Candidatus Polarisedimenticolia bacterium]